MKKVIDVRDRYSREISDIKYILDCLEQGRYYEKTNARMDGYLATNISQLREKITDLLFKIEYNKDSITEELTEIFKNYQI